MSEKAKTDLETVFNRASRVRCAEVRAMPYGLDCAICGQCTPLFATYSEMRSWMICAGWEMTEPNAQRAVCDECLERFEEGWEE